MLLDGTMDAVITQNPQTSLMDCINIFSSLRAGRALQESTARSRTELILRENLP
jgi:LacI family transcriptional regulator